MNGTGEPIGCDVLLVFVNDIEKEAVVQTFTDKGQVKPENRFGYILTYHDFGIIGNVNHARVKGIQINMGGISRGGAAASVSDAIHEANPAYIILVGVAFAMDRDKFLIGDILVSRQLFPYELQKITVKNDKLILIPRGENPVAPEKIMGMFRALSGKPFWTGTPVHFESLLSGEKLLDHPDFKKKLQEQYPEAAGGEMEAAGAYAAAAFYKRDWLVVKGVCDYADGLKEFDKDKNQRLAAKNAAEFVFHVLKNGDFSRSPHMIVNGPMGHEPEEPVLVLTPTRQHMLELIIKNIIHLLEYNQARFLREALHEQLTAAEKTSVANDRITLAHTLVQYPVLQSVLLLNKAVKAAIDNIQRGCSSDVTEAIDRTWNSGVAVLGWLVLNGVGEEWAETAAQCLEKAGEYMGLCIPVETEPGADIAYSWLHKTAACLDMDEMRNELVGRHRIKCLPLDPKFQWTTKGKVFSIKVDLWKQVFRLREIPSKWTTGNDEELDYTLFIRQDKGEHHYIAVNSAAVDNPLLDHEVYNELKKDLPHLEILFLGSQGRGMVAIISEYRLNALLREFFRDKPGLKR